MRGLDALYCRVHGEQARMRLFVRDDRRGLQPG